MGPRDLCHRFTSAQNSRHIDRKLFKMREMRGAGIVTVTHVPTEINPADSFTKILSRQLWLSISGDDSFALGNVQIAVFAPVDPWHCRRSHRNQAASAEWLAAHST